MANLADYKWYILFLACMITFGGYYSFDYPSVLHNQLRRHFGFEKNEFELYFSLLYSLYSMPNIILPGFGGILSDIWGNNRVMLVCATLVMMGNILLFIATWRVDWFMLEVGRFIFGIGAETLQVCANTTIAKWFDGQELAFALGINLSVCKLGGVMTDWLSPYINETFGIETSAGVVTILCAMSYFLTIHLVNCDSQPPAESTSHPHEQQAFNQTTTTSYKASYGSLSTLDNDGNLEMTDRRFTALERRGSYIESSKNACSMFGLNIYTWLAFLLTFVMYGIFVPFNNISNAIILEVFYDINQEDNVDVIHYEEIAAARLQSIPYFLSVLITPFLGWGIDRFGYRTTQVVLACALLVYAHIYIYNSTVGPSFPLLLIGLSYSVFGSVIWACIPLIVPPSHHGAAYGIMSAFQNAGQALVPLLLQYVIRVSGRYRECELVLAAMAGLAVLLAATLYGLDYVYNNNTLQMSTV